MIFEKSVILIFIPLIVALGIQDRVAKKADKAIIKFYDIENFTKAVVTIDSIVNEETPSDFSKNNFFKIVYDNNFKGYGYIGNAASMTANFDYLILLDDSFTITKSQVLIYREEYGGEIGSKRWLKQFIGKKEGEELIHGKDIVAISGATISTTSMTSAINDLLKSLAVIKSKGIQ
ncbi:MAG: FMN-binding protein [Bacteroidia bacterium]|nr:FMN-binding protein [Bacteroidia bacterium]NNK28466.1 FMN-binding protein [Flavobacteriaceae bacterium]